MYHTNGMLLKFSNSLAGKEHLLEAKQRSIIDMDKMVRRHQLSFVVYLYQNYFWTFGPL